MMFCVLGFFVFSQIHVPFLQMFFIPFFSRASSAVNCLDRLHQLKKRALTPYSLFLEFLTMVSCNIVLGRDRLVDRLAGLLVGWSADYLVG